MRRLCGQNNLCGGCFGDKKGADGQGVAYPFAPKGAGQAGLLGII